MNDFLNRCREWQKSNQQWTLICDLPGGTDHLYEQWEELPQKVKMHWIGTYREGYREMFEEFGTKRCKVLKMILMLCALLYA